MTAQGPSVLSRDLPTADASESAGARLGALLDQWSRPGGTFDPAALRELDEAEAFPADAVGALDGFGLADHYVPLRHGGALVDLAELLWLLRTVARHDVTTAVAHAKTFLGAAPVWVAGDDAFAADLARHISEGRIVAWGLTEPGHGADLLAGETTARREGSGWVLDGEKWLINNATRAASVCVLARTREGGGPRGFDLFLVDKDELAEGSWAALPKVPTHGIRGADISGVRFDHAQVADSARVGAEGAGLELVLKALQLTRTVSVGLSLGACDHALEITTEFVRGRRLYGRFLVELPRIRRILADALADLFLMEAVSFVAGRAATHAPAEMGVLSAVAKAFVPSTGDGVIAELGEILGVRAFFTEDHAEGAFARLERDHRIVAIFDGSTAVNRHSLIKAFPILARAAGVDHTEHPPSAPAGLTSFERDDDTLDCTRLALTPHGGLTVLRSLPRAAEHVDRAVADGRAPAQLAELVGIVTGLVDRVQQDLADHRPRATDVPEADFELARRYELCVAAAAALQVWATNEQQVGPGRGLWADAAWLQVALARVVRGLGEDELRRPEAEEAVVGELVDGRTATIVVPR